MPLLSLLPSLQGGADAPFSRKKLYITYTGTVYHEFQDVSLIFKALSMLPEDLKDYIVVSFLGSNHDVVMSKAKDYNVEGMVVVSSGVLPFTESVKWQKSSDYLLFLLAHGEQADGIFTGKLFEYIGARRPIIATGNYADGAVCDFIRDKNRGHVYSDAEKLRDDLAESIRKKVIGQEMIAPTDENAASGLERDKQFVKLLDHVSNFIVQ